jgi:hypothetical protein
MATEKRYSLVDIFQMLKEANFLFEDTQIKVASDGESDNEIITHMNKSEYIAMTVAHELTSAYSRLACNSFTAKKKDVIEAMREAGYDKVAYPNYESFGILRYKK